MKTARRAIQMLRLFSRERPYAGVSQLAREMNTDKATAHRLLSALMAERVVEQHPVTRQYGLGLGVVDIAAVRLAQFGLIESAEEELEALRDQTGETVVLLIRDDFEMLCIAAFESKAPLRVGFFVGERVPIHISAAGLLYLCEQNEQETRRLVAASAAKYAHLPKPSAETLERKLKETRRRGWADTETRAPDSVHSLSAPIRGADQLIQACISVASPGSRTTKDTLRRNAQLLQEACERVQQRCRGTDRNARPVRVGNDVGTRSMPVSRT
jgi:DNA-binding IclR family transcriptional regulator